MVIVAGTKANLAMSTLSWAWGTAATGAGICGAGVGCPPAARGAWLAAPIGTFPVWSTILRGALPTGIVSATVPVARSTTETLLDASFVTYAKWLSEVAA